jgi:Carboxypeptidase regulatory-like domain
MLLNPELPRGGGMLWVLFLAANLVHDQVAATALTGTVTGPSGAAVANAKISVKNADTGQIAEAQADAHGVYTVPNLAPGDYEVSVAAEGLGTKVATVKVIAGAAPSLNVALSAAGAPTLEDLGFKPEEAKGNAAEQERLNKRSHMLKVHQRLGLITIAPLVATLISSNGAAGRHGTASGRELHAALGSATAGLYLSTAYFAVFAPKIAGTPVRGPIRLHRALAWVHGPGMILTPVLGALAYDQRSRGEKVHGIASLHSTVAIITGAAYGLAIASVSIKF